MLGHHTGTVPSHSHCNMAYFRITRAEFHVHVPTGSDWIEALWALSTLVFPSPCDSHHAIWCGISTFISGRSVSHTALTSQMIGFVGGTGPATGPAASAMRWHGLQRAPFSQKHPKGSCKLQFENQPSVLSSHLEDVGSTWHWVVDAVNGEDNRRQGIDLRTWNVVLLEREGDQRIFLTQGLNLGLLHRTWILYHLSHQGCPWNGMSALIKEIPDRWPIATWKDAQYC